MLELFFTYYNVLALQALAPLSIPDWLLEMKKLGSKNSWRKICCAVSVGRVKESELERLLINSSTTKSGSALRRKRSLMRWCRNACDRRRAFWAESFSGQGDFSGCIVHTCDLHFNSLSLAVTRLIGTYSWTLRKWWGWWCRTRGSSRGRRPCAAAGTRCSGSRRRHSSIAEGLKKGHDLVNCLPKHPGSASIDLDLTFKSPSVTWTVFHGWMGKAWQFLFQLLIAWTLLNSGS